MVAFDPFAVIPPPCGARGPLHVRNLALPVVACLIPLLGCATVISETGYGDVEGVKRLLAEGHLPDEHSAIDRASDTRALCVAIEKRNAEIAKILLDAGASAHDSCWDYRDFAFYEPARYAAQHGDAATVKLLLEHGVDPLPKEVSGTSLMTYFVHDTTQYPDESGITGIILDAILRQHGLEAMKRAATELLWRAAEGKPLVIGQVFKRGFDPNGLVGEGTVTYEAWPPLYFAVAAGHKGVVDELIGLGASFDVRSSNGREIREVAGSIRAARAAEEREFEREMNLLKDEAEREEEEERRSQGDAFFNAFNAAMTGGASSGPVSNPVDDDSFERKMKAIYEESTTSRDTPPDDDPSPSASPIAPTAPVPPPVSVSGPAIAEADGAASVGATAGELNGATRAEAERRKEEARRLEEERLKEAERKHAEAAKAADEQERQTYLATMRNGIRMAATKCPDGEGHYYAIGKLPRATGDHCIDVTYRATCATNRSVSRGVMRSFVGGGSCFGDSHQISPKPSCPVEQVTVQVDDVQFCR